MKIIDLKKGIVTDSVSGPLCLLLGNFDGVHEGHATLARAALEEGRRLGVKVAVWTFEVHPLICFGKEVKILTDNAEKNAAFADLGIDYVIYESFPETKDMLPLDFINDVLIDRYDAKAVVCGFNFKFGKEGKGTPELLTSEMEKAGRSVTVVHPVSKMGKVVSSTVIRAYLEKGRVEDAAEMLGRYYSINTPVIHGNEIGRTIGVPTINQRFERGKMKPQSAIYACKCYVNGKEYLGVANVGSRPTVNDDVLNINCETHIIDFSGWLYGKLVKVCFCKKLRDERKFDGIDELKEAIQNDIEQTRAFFAEQERLENKVLE